MNKKTIDNIQLEGKRVVLRVDFNVPIEDGVITSENRIDAAMETIIKVISSNGKLILLSHLGRIKSEQDKEGKSLQIVAKALANKLGKEIIFSKITRGKALTDAVNEMKNGQVLMIENTRFEDFKNGEATRYESDNNETLARYWASLADVFINDAFGTAHREHASNVGVASYVSETAVGYLVQKEIKMLSKGLDDPKRPFVAIIGGAKVSDKIGVISNLIKRADRILIGGGMAYTFLKALGYSIGNSLVEDDKLELAKELLRNSNGKIVLPIDHAISSEYEDTPREECGLNIPNGKMGLDIGSKTIKLYGKALKGAKTIVWNGPMGVSEFSNYKLGTETVASSIVNERGVFSIVGGGDSVAAVTKLGFANQFSHISTGGGASLVYMEGKPLPAIQVIQNADGFIEQQ